MSLIQRFEGEAGRALLEEMLREQTLAVGNPDLAKDLADLGELVEVPAGGMVIEQGNFENDVYFIVFGSCDIVVNGKRVNTRRAGTHVGEMAAVQPSQTRAATVVAAEPTVFLKLSEPHFSAVAKKHPTVWKLVARELARRLEQRNALVTEAHDQVRVFIISSAEAIEVARAIQNGLERDALVTVWTDGVFRASAYTIESLERAVDQSDFAIAIANPDDVTESREEIWPTPRDNVVFELGLFMGRLGRQRSFLVERRGEEIKLPSDLAGLTSITYRWSGKQGDLAPSVAPVCNRLREIIKDLGPNN